MTCIDVGLVRSYVKAFTFPYEKAYNYMQFDCVVYQQIVGISMGTSCVQLIADLFLYCY